MWGCAFSLLEGRLRIYLFVQSCWTCLILCNSCRWLHSSWCEWNLVLCRSDNASDFSTMWTVKRFSKPHPLLMLQWNFLAGTGRRGFPLCVVQFLCFSSVVSIYKGTVGHQNVSCPSGSTIKCITDQIILWRSGTRFHSLADSWLFTARNLSLLLLEPKPCGGGVEHSRLRSSRLKWCNVGFFPGVGKQRAKAYSVGQAFGKLP